MSRATIAGSIFVAAVVLTVEAAVAQVVFRCAGGTVQKCDTMRRPVCRDEPNTGQWVFKVDFKSKLVWFSLSGQLPDKPRSAHNWGTGSEIWLETTQNGGIKRDASLHVDRLPARLQISREIDLGRSPAGYHQLSDVATVPCTMSKN
jgi:hypothetical protein